MSFTSKSPVAVARHALRVGAEALPRYAHPNSPKKFTQPQLFACLLLKPFFNTAYPAIPVHLEALPDLLRALALKSVPHWTTLHKATKRLLKPGRGQPPADRHRPPPAGPPPHYPPGRL